MSYSEKQFKQAVTWFVHLQSDQCTEQDRQLFASWFHKSAAHQKAYIKAEQVWSDFDGLKSMKHLDALEKARIAKANKQVPNIATLLLFAVLAGGGLCYEEYSAETLHYQTKQGEQKHLLLSDGSTLDLNTNTELNVKLSWLQRHVELQQGEALFSVQHQAWRPFTVQASDLTIRDVGTQFNVHLQNNNVTVAVLDGEVELSDTQSLKQHLSAGHQRSYNAKQQLSSETSVNHEHITAWLNGKLVFNHTPLSEVTAELERYHPIKFKFSQPQLANQTLSGTFNAQELSAFLQAIEPMLGIQAKHQGNVIVLHAKKS